MAKTIISEGKTTAEAIEKGLKAIGLPKELVEIKVIDDNKCYKIMLFGSRARGDYKQRSDIDLAVLSEISREEQYKIMNEIDHNLLIKKGSLSHIVKKIKYLYSKV